MGKIIRPDYYRDFQCIASSCTDSCCVGWEIDIDETTLEYYRGVGGAFGQRLKKDIVWNTEEDAELPHFKQTDRERCPFLNACNLCDIFIHLGEEHLSQICTHHPRFYDWLPDREEGGLGLCCEEAARLILTCPEPYRLCVEEDGEEEPAEEDEDLLLERELLTCLYEGREEMFDVIRGCQAADAEALAPMLDRIWQQALALQDRYDAILFPETEELCDLPEEDSIEGNADGALSGWTTFFWQEEFLRELITFLKKLEINDTLWWKKLLDLEKHLPELLKERNKKFQIPADRLQDTGRLLFYFLYRHLLKAREDDNVLGHVAMALGSVSVLLLLDYEQLRQKNSLTEWEEILLAKLYSKEIEYDEENTIALGEFLADRKMA